MNHGGELRRRGKYGGKDNGYRTEHVKREVSLGYPGEYIDKTNGNKHLEQQKHQYPEGS